MNLVIKTTADGTRLVARIQDYAGPIPRPGDDIFHPPWDDDGVAEPCLGTANVMNVKSVIYGILTRPRHGGGYFTGREEPMVEVWV